MLRTDLVRTSAQRLQILQGRNDELASSLAHRPMLSELLNRDYLLHDPNVEEM